MVTIFSFMERSSSHKKLKVLKNLYIEDSRVNVHEYTSKHGVYARVLM